MATDKRLQDCYFFYYSTCTKGEHCGFRHEPSALGCETVCQFWRQGKCNNQQCHLRHMELKKNRKAIPCYWETQPSGCRKPHCPFLHKASRDAQKNDSQDERPAWWNKECEAAVKERKEAYKALRDTISAETCQRAIAARAWVKRAIREAKGAHEPARPLPEQQPPQQQQQLHQPITMQEPLIVSLDPLHLY